MTGLVPVIHVVKPPESFGLAGNGRVDGRDEPAMRRGQFELHGIRLF
jgi:hypothetical protein